MSETRLIHGDCLEYMKDLDSGSIDLVLTDPPYGTTACKWDSVIPFEPMWEQLNRLIKKNGALVLCASQPFTSALIMSNPIMFKHEWVWIKNRGSNFANTAREPMKEHESVIVFSNKKWTYNKQMQHRTGTGLDRVKYNVEFSSAEREGTRKFEGCKTNKLPDMRVPSSWQKFNTESGKEKVNHPTQKPVALMEYLIKTYTHEEETVLDFTMGSGTTGVAAKNLNRNFIGIEKSKEYFELAKDRINNHVVQKEML